MPRTLFYSWQNDISPNLNRNFIEDALKKAIEKINKDLIIQEALRDENLTLDKDTKGIPGTPPITDIILKKISASSIFVPDLTFVGKTSDGKPISNPNVLIEYGWALNALSGSRIVAVMNKAFGGPAGLNMPFNLRHLRFPIVFNLTDSTKTEERTLVKTQLVTDLYNAIQLIWENEISKEAKEQNPFVGREDYTDPSTFIKPGETFYDTSFLARAGSKISFSDGARIFLRLIPSKTVFKIPTGKDAEDIIRRETLIPLGLVSSWSYGRNEYGAFSHHTEENVIYNFTQLFLNGELWGIDATLLNREWQSRFMGDQNGIILFDEIEKILFPTLNHYLKFSRNVLKSPTPLKLITGLTGIKGYRMPPDIYRLNQNTTVVNDKIIYEHIIETYEEKPHLVLIPFFGLIWKECGLERPRGLDNKFSQV